ncbi:hypothetical protein DXG03_000140 [Asterophora parasitica]|uniref:Uncharacterized protein n=1 Tax=Asterophora parasitica TaxID=117018 RepID=A0A9P7KE59_9AGAR|nr:hypothetical protein DXG03_000140 [Asterophora parasitica]
MSARTLLSLPATQSPSSILGVMLTSMKRVLATLDLAAALMLLLKLLVSVLYPPASDFVVDICATMLFIDEVLDMPQLLEHRQEKPFFSVGDALKSHSAAYSAKEELISTGASCFLDFIALSFRSLLAEVTEVDDSVLKPRLL